MGTRIGRYRLDGIVPTSGALKCIVRMIPHRGLLSRGAPCSRLRKYDLNKDQIMKTASRLHRPTSSFRRQSPPGKPLLLCLSHLRWNFVFQRPQHLLTRALTSYRVLFFEEPFLDADEPYLSLEKREDGLTIAQPHLPASYDTRARDLALRSLLDDALADLDTQHPKLIWYYSPAMMAFSSHLEADCVVYDCMDELSAFRGAPPDLRKREHELFGRADLVFTGGLSLFEAKRRMHPAVYAFPSSIDKAHFGKARKSRLTQAQHQTPHLGFFGVIDERMDLALVAAIADLRPDWQFSMIGPVVKIDHSELPQRPNLHWCGGRDYQDLPAELAHWTIGIMPFALNEATRFISPTKTPEFLSAGLPVISTPIRDVVRPYGDQGLVGIAETAESFVTRCEEALSWTASEHKQWLTRVDRFLARISWDQTWADMNGLVERLIANRQRVRAAQMKPTLTPLRSPGVARV